MKHRVDKRLRPAIETPGILTSPCRMIWVDWEARTSRSAKIVVEIPVAQPSTPGRVASGVPEA